jgi:hypothetical protein
MQVKRELPELSTWQSDGHPNGRKNKKKVSLNGVFEK